MNEVTCSSRVWLSSLAVLGSLLLLPSGVAFAQADSPDVAQPDVIEEVIVVGVRRSLEIALENKRNADSIMDGIAAEGIGRFPDLNLAESLQRVTGVQIDTAGVGGDLREGQIAIRGLPKTYSRTTYNGQTLASPAFNDGFTFGVFESDVVSAVNVIKSPTARHDEGGLSGVIDIRTLRPLDIGEDFLSIGAEMDYEDLSQDTNPSGSLAWGHKFADDRVGVFASLKYSEQNFRTDDARVTRYRSSDDDGDGLADLYWPTRTRVVSRQMDGDRTSLAAGIEFAPRDNLRIGVLGLHSDRYLFNEMDMLRAWDPRSVVFQGPAVSGGSFGDTITELAMVNPDVNAESRLFIDEYVSQALTADVEWTSDDWTARGVLHYTKGERDRFALMSRRWFDNLAGNGIEVLLNTGAGSDNGYVLQSVSGDFSDPDFWSYGADVNNNRRPPDEARQRFLASGGTDREETETAFQFDLIRHFDSDSLVSSIEGGVKFRQFERHQVLPSWSTAGLVLNTIDDIGVLRPHLGTGGSGFQGGGVDVVDYWVPDWRPVRDAVISASDISGPTFGGLPLRISNSRTFDTERDIFSAYAMLNFDGGNVPIRGNIGVRYVDTNRAVDAYRRGDLVPGGEAQTSAELDFSHTLPSLNVIWDLRDNLLLRFAYSETIVRPNAHTFRADQTVRVDFVDPEETILDDVTIRLGNPELMPFEAEAYDFSLEWYNREGSGVSLALFRKEVVNGIDNRQLCPSSILDIPALSDYTALDALVSGDLTLIGDVCTDAAGTTVLIEDSVNVKEGFTINGWELGILQNFDNLPAPWNGFGIQANYTYVDTSESANFDASGNRLPLTGVSEDTYNAILYYETDDWGARLAYNNRSEYFVTFTGTFSGDDRYIAGRDRLDFSSSWRVNDNMTLRAEVFNVLDEVITEYQGVEERMRNIKYDGRIYTLALRYRF